MWYRFWLKQDNRLAFTLRPLKRPTEGGQMSRTRIGIEATSAALWGEVIDKIQIESQDNPDATVKTQDAAAVNVNGAGTITRGRHKGTL